MTAIDKKIDVHGNASTDRTPPKQTPIARSGFSMLELIIAIVVLAVTAAGAMHYQFHAARQIRMTQAEQTAMRTAQLILEDWKSRGGNDQYSPVDLKMGFTASGANQYKVTVDDLPMLVRTNYTNVDTDPVASVTLRQIQTIIRWRSDFTQGDLEISDPIYVMTAYVRLDQAGG